MSQSPASPKIKLDTQDDRNNALNMRLSFTNLVSSASLIFPPEIDTVVITRDTFVVEWNEFEIPPTQVTQILSKNRQEEVKSEIHRTSLNIPLYYSNQSSSSNAVEAENRLIVPSQIIDTDTSLSPRQIERAASLSRETLNEKANEKKEKRSQEKLNKAINIINQSLGYFEYLPMENVPVRDKRSVSICCR